MMQAVKWKVQVYPHTHGNLITFVKDRPIYDWRYAIDAEKMNKEVGWKPVETFETGIKKTINWYLEQ